VSGFYIAQINVHFSNILDLVALTALYSMPRDTAEAKISVHTENLKFSTAEDDISINNANNQQTGALNHHVTGPRVLIEIINNQNVFPER
jgi:hypothetical protein